MRVFAPGRVRRRSRSSATSTRSASSITNVDEDGLLSFITVGGIGPETLHGQRFELLTANGRIPAAVARKRIYPEQMRDRQPLELSDLHLDIGAKSREEAEQLVHVGDAGVWGGEPAELPNGRLLSKGLDNRLGAYVALEAARRVGKSGDAQVDVVAVAAVQEEIGIVRCACRGVRGSIPTSLSSSTSRLQPTFRGATRSAPVRSTWGWAR